MPKIPDFVTQYLWDADLNQLDLEANKQFVIERILEYGDEPAVNWMQTHYKQDEITQVLKTSKRISAKTGHFYALLYQLDQSTLRCLTQPYTQKQNRF
jgi:hypothetical protein